MKSNKSIEKQYRMYFKITKYFFKNFQYLPEEKIISKFYGKTRENNNSMEEFNYLIKSISD